MAVARFLLLFVVFLAVLQVVLFYGDLPDVMATHFDGAGSANDWSSKTSFFVTYAVILVLRRPLERRPLGTRGTQAAPEGMTE